MGWFFTLALLIGCWLFLGGRLVNSLRTRKFVALRLYLPGSVYDRAAEPIKYWAAIIVTAIVALVLTWDIVIHIRQF